MKNKSVSEFLTHSKILFFLGNQDDTEISKWNLFKNLLIWSEFVKNHQVECEPRSGAETYAAKLWNSFKQLEYIVDTNFVVANFFGFFSWARKQVNKQTSERASERANERRSERKWSAGVSASEVTNAEQVNE